LSDTWTAILTGLLLLINFFLAWSCYSLRDFSRSRLDEICRSHGKKDRFSTILRRYEQALLALELLYTLTLAAVVATIIYWSGIWQVIEAGPDWLGWLAVVSQVIVGAAFLILALIVVPWTMARVAGEHLLYRAWPLINALSAALRPFVWLAFHIDKLLHRLAGQQEPQIHDAATITEEILAVVEEGQLEGLLESEARTMIHRVMELQEEDVAAVMTPRTDIVSIQVDSSLEEARRKLLEAGHSRVPVIGESTDDVIGVLYAKDLLEYFNTRGQPPSLREIVREPLYVPETTGIDKLLQTMKRERVQLAIVLDEYGGVAGLVTMEDILEEIVGEIVDEHDIDEEEDIELVEPNITVVGGRVHIDDLNEQFEYGLPEDGDFETVGGFAFSILGRIPTEGESFTWHQLRFTVLEADKRKITKLRIEVDQTLAATSSEEA
jgi:putative hemolysin